MEEGTESRPERGYMEGDVNNEKYVSGFSTLLVATIQEARDRISQIEYIFCQQLFPDFQSRTKCLRAVYTEARKASEDLWKKKEADLLSELQVSRDQAMFLKLENEKMVEQKTEWTRMQKEMAERMELSVREHENEKRNILKRVEEGETERGELVGRMEMKEEELGRVKKRGNDLVVAYKQLKSQYNFLCKQKGLHPIDSSGDIKADGSRSPAPAINIPSEEGVSDDESNKIRVLIPTTRQPDPTPVNKTVSVCKTKKMTTHWRETRSRDVTEGPDTQDDFLNTPLQAARKTRQRVDPGPCEIDGPSSSDERGCLIPGPGSGSGPGSGPGLGPGLGPGSGLGSGFVGARKQVVPPQGPGGKGGFKHVETVRKKTEREMLKGVECKQCKKFYDVVGGTVGCSHLDDVSRHRYRYAPPSTPDGFWNIGFDSEI